MMLTTPPKASVPYTAEALSVRISTRSMAVSGIEFRSTAAVPVKGLPGTRRPLISTAVRSAPRPRKLINAIWPKLEPDRSRNEPKLLYVLVRSKSATFSRPVRSISSRSMIVIGLGASDTSRRIREPVTMTISSIVSSSISAAMVGMAGSVTRDPAVTAPIALAKGVFLNIGLPLRLSLGLVI